MDEDNLKCFYLKNGATIICKRIVKASDEVVFEDILMLKEKFVFVDMKLISTFCLVPLGFPANKYPNSLDGEDISILFEIELNDDQLKKIYEDSVLELKSPHIVKPKNNSKIIH